MKPFERKGEWWLPENPERRVSGILAYSPTGGLSLTLIGSLKDRSEWTKADSASRSVPIILGNTTEGKHFTLCECFNAGVHIRQSSVTAIETSIAARFAVEGWHFHRVEDILCNRLGINYWYLDEWADVLKFETDEPPVADGGFDNYQLRYGISHPVTAQIDTTKVSVKSVWNRHMGVEGCSVTVTPYIVIEPASPTPLLSLWKNEQYHAYNFIMLAMGQRIHPREVQATCPAAVRFLANGEPYTENLSVYLPAQHEPESSLSRLHVLFFLKSILPDFERYLRVWFSKSATLKPVCDLFFGTLTNTSMYLGHKFLSLSQALETYHRRTKPAKYVDDEEWEGTKAALAAAIPQSLAKDFRASLKNKLNYLHEFSLRKRLKDVLEQCGAQAGVTVLDEKAFVEDVTNTRNYLTHYDKRLEGQAMKDGDLYALTEAMRCLLEVCFLTEIGVERTTIQRIARGNARFQRYIQPLAD